MIIIQRVEEIPQFKDEDEEDAFWEAHSLAAGFFTERGLRLGSLVAMIAERRAADQGKRP